MLHEYIHSVLITGLRLGSVYALIALGYTMVYGIIKLINFAALLALFSLALQRAGFYT